MSVIGCVVFEVADEFVHHWAAFSSFYRRFRHFFSSHSTSSFFVDFDVVAYSFVVIFTSFFRRFQLRNFSSLSMLFFISFDVVVFRRHFFRHFRRRRFFRPRPENTSFFVAFEVVFPSLSTSSFFRLFQSRFKVLSMLFFRRFRCRIFSSFFPSLGRRRFFVSTDLLTGSEPKYPHSQLLGSRYAVF